MIKIDYKLDGKVAFVSGGSHGIGLEISKYLGSLGCKIAFCSRTSERLDQAKKILNNLNLFKSYQLFKGIIHLWQIFKNIYYIF